MIGLFDPRTRSVLVSKVSGVWSFCQGGLYDPNLNESVKEILRRELGVEESRFKLVFSKPLGLQKFAGRMPINRSRIATVSLFPSLRGKGYLACFTQIRLAGIETELRRGEGVEDVRPVPVAEARALVTEGRNAEHGARKTAMILSMLDEIERLRLP